jgi:hypothetical protein
MRFLTDRVSLLSYFAVVLSGIEKERYEAVHC